MIYETPFLETERLIMKRGNKSDYQRVYEYDFTKLRNVNNEFEFVKLDETEIKDWYIPYDNSYDWIVYLKDTKIPIANIVADREFKQINSIELAFNTHPSYWRKGYTFEALVAIINFLFEQGYDNLICCYDEGNVNSKNLGEKLGFIPYDANNKIWEKDGVKITSYATILSKSMYMKKCKLK